MSICNPSAHCARSAGIERPWRPVPLERLEGGLDLGWKSRLAEHEVAAHLVDDVELIDRHRTLLNAGATARARPELLFADVGVEQPVLQHLCGGRRAGVVAFAVQQRGAQKLHPVSEHDRRLLHQPLPGVDDDLARAEQLAREVGRTGGRAAPALRAGVAVEQILPREILDIRGAKVLDVGLEIHRPHHAFLTGSAGVREVDVDQRRHDVQVLGVREVVEKGENQQRVHPPEQRRQRVRSRIEWANHARDGP